MFTYGTRNCKNAREMFEVWRANTKESKFLLRNLNSVLLNNVLETQGCTNISSLMIFG